MLTWKTHLRGVLQRLACTHARTPLSEIEQILAEVLDARDVRFQDVRGRDLHGDASLAGLLSAPFTVTVRVECAPARMDSHASHFQADEDARRGEAPLGNASASYGEGIVRRAETAAQNVAGTAPAYAEETWPHAGGDGALEDRYELFCREFDRLEKRHGFMWAGYIVKELLPRLGFDPDGAKAVLDQLQADGLVKVSKVPNPRNPLFPATGVQLNREHPRVQAALGNGEPHAAPTRFVAAEETAP